MTGLMASARLRREPAVFYVRGGEKALRFMQWMACRPQWLRSPLVYEIHSIQYLDLLERHDGRYGEGQALEAYRQARRALEADVYARLDGVVTISEALKRLIERDFTLRRAPLVARSGALVPAAPAPPWAERDVDIAYVGGLYEYNGVELLVRAMALAPGRRLVVVGGGTGEQTEALRRAAEEAGVSDRVEFRGYVPHPEALEWMRRARVLAAPLRLNPAQDRISWCNPGKLVEYMASGAAIVCSRIESLQEMLNDRNSILVEPNSVEALAAGIHKAFSDPQQAARLGTRAGEDAKEHSYDARARKIMRFLEELAGRGL
ncbi:MAG: D-inositol 3-phosphate glycosyltransferase [candidate division BRC1 bacterium ADurb.BinA364]|nr:MAG: D-inositol 3-phosphate glycosyltransferase [candidate division BRC1 bacterium ADurb.BinA364]